MLRNLLLPFLAIFMLMSCSKEDELLSDLSNNTVNQKTEVPPPSAGIISSGNNPLYWVRNLIQNIQPSSNFYDTKADSVTWAGQQNAVAYYCSTDCSGLLTKLFKQSYGYSNAYFKTWTGYSNPFASSYYNEIVTKDRFSRILNISQIAQGDIIALKYPPGSTNTGHIMVAEGPAILRTASAPLVSGTKQYEIWVNDCTSSGHGSLDTRYNGGNWDDGVGRGIFRIYADSKGNMVGYTWSTYSNSIYYKQSERQLAVGRHIP